MKQDPFKYLKVLLRGRKRVGLDDTYVNINRRMFAALIDVCLMMLLLEPVLNIYFQQFYPNPVEDMSYAQQLLANAANSEEAKQQFLHYMSDTGLWDWFVVSVVTQLSLFIIVMILFWTKYGATPGKMILGIRIIDSRTGKTPSALQNITRLIGYGLSFLPFMLGFFWIQIDKKRQAWHDKFAHTVVVYKNAPTLGFEAVDPSDSLAP